MLGARLFTSAALAAAAIGVLAGGATASGSSYVVTNTNASGPGSLADAVAAADGNPGADTITFNVAGTITLTQQLNVTDDVTIAGPGARSLTISGGGTTRVFSVAAGVSLALGDVTVADANGDFYGGALANNAGHVSIVDSAFTDNVAPSPWVGGAIYSVGGTLDIVGTTFSGNSSSHGGAIYLDFGADATITNSTLSGNTTFAGDGAAIFTGGTLTLNSTTIAGNAAARYAGGIYAQFGSVTLENTIVADNTAGAPGADARPECAAAAPIVDRGGNLQYPGSDCGSFTSADPKLDPAGLTDNGGPTDTIGLTGSSPAVDGGLSVDCPATDQRGVARPQGSACDIGAFELVQRPTTVAQCKDGGWTAFGVFRNQGDCVSYVATQGKNPPNG